MRRIQDVVVLPERLHQLLKGMKNSNLVKTVSVMDLHYIYNNKRISFTMLLLLVILLKLPDLFFVRVRAGSVSLPCFVPPPGWCPAITDPYSSKLESKDAVLVSLSKDSPANALQLQNMLSCYLCPAYFNMSDIDY